MLEKKTHVDDSRVQRVGWRWTINNPILQPEEVIQELKTGPVLPTFIVFQLEVGEDGTVHYQGYVKFLRSVRRAYVVRRLPRASVRPADATAEENEVYCTKLKDRVDGPYRWGTYKKT